MRFYFLPVLIFLTLISCSSILNRDTSFYEPGISTFSEEKSPLRNSLSHSIAKVYRNNSVTGAGVFVSEDGLFLTNYSNLITHFASQSSAENFAFEKEFIATSKREEIPLEGFSLLVEIEQKDVTSEIRSTLTDSSSNYEIYQTTQGRKQQLSLARKGTDEDIFVEIKDLYSGNQQIMTVYQIIRDVRLVFAPSIEISSANINDSMELLEKTSNEYVFLRAYSSPDNLLSSYSELNVPFNINYSFPISLEKSERTDSIFVVGFPNNTYRLESAKAIEFYHTRLNPYVESTYEIYLKKEETLAKQNENYAITSIPNRVNTAQNVTFFRTIQESISKKNILAFKTDEDANFVNWVDLSGPDNIEYSGLLHSIKQAYEIAERTSDLLYSVSYFSSVSKLDDLAAPFIEYSTLDLSNYDSNQIEAIKERVINTQKSLLDENDIALELTMMEEFLVLFSGIPKIQQPLSLFDLFDSNKDKMATEASAEFIEAQKPTSFLLNPSKAYDALSNNSLYDDPFFLLLDELAFALKAAQQNNSLHYAYLYPAQQVFARGKIEQTKPDKLTADAISILSYNLGSIDYKRTNSESPYFYTTNDFSGRCQGSALLNSNGELIGIVSDEITENVLGNYYYSQESSFVKGLRITSILDKLRSSEKASYLIDELNLETPNQ